MPEQMKSPEGFKVVGKDGAALSVWDEVEGADGYKLQFFSADDPEKCIKSRYAQGTRKMIMGFENGKEYLVRVCAIRYERDVERRGSYTQKLSFVPKCVKLKAQGTICLNIGEKEQLICERGEEITAVKYVSENTEIAAVSPSGVVTARSAGVTFINITAGGGQSFRTKIVVERAARRGRGSSVIMLAGDLMCTAAHQRAVQDCSYDFNDAFSSVKPLFEKADYVIGVLSMTCCDSKPYEHERPRLENGGVNCNAPSTYISACANAGFNGLVTATNHNSVAGRDGLEDTVAEIKRLGMENFGTLGDDPVIVKVNGIKLGVIACSMISNSLESTMGADALSIVSVIGKYDKDYFVELVNRAKAQGAEYIIAYQHWGRMNSIQVEKSQKEAARFMADAGADIIVGSHPHVVQRLSYIVTKDGRRVPCAYSLGNFVTTMKELRENRDSAVLRLELRRDESGSVSSKLSYIPTLSEDAPRGTAAVEVFPPHSEISRDSFQRTKAAMGNAVRHFTHKPVVMLSGSAVLRDIFTAGKGFRLDKTALGLSQISLGAEKSFDPPEDCDGSLSLEFEKDIAGYIKERSPDIFAVDFFAAASASCFKTDSVRTEEPCYFTNTKQFRQTEFFKKRTDIVKVNPPFGEEIWKPLIKRYSEAVRDSMPREKVILFRTSVGNRRFRGTQLRSVNASDRRDKLTRAMEDMFISIVDPIVVDLSQYYMVSDSKISKFEPEYYIDAYNAALEVAAGKGITFIGTPDADLWFDRIMRYYDSMTARSYQSWLLDMNCAADKIIARTNKDFSALYRERLLRLKRAGNADLNTIREFFANDIGAGELVNAGELIAAVERGNLSRPYDFYAPAFDGHYNILKTMVRLLAAETGVAVKESTAELVFLLRGNTRFSRFSAFVNNNTIDVWGGAVSREAINRCESAYVGKYIVRQPQILAFDPPVDIEFPNGAEAFCGSYWRRRTMRASFTRNGFETLADSEARWIMVDFYDLICTMSEYMGELFETDDFIRRTDFYKNIEDDCRACYIFEKRDMKFCFETITRFANEIREHYGNRIILLKTDLKDKYITLDDRLKPLEKDNMLKFKKKFLALCEERFASVTECYIIDIARFFWSSDKFPLGGADTVHYEEEFFRQSAEYIAQILEGRERKLYADVNENYLLLRNLKLERE